MSVYDKKLAIIRSRREGGAFIAVPIEVLRSPAVISLSANARRLLIDLMAQFRYGNNGDLSVSRQGQVANPLVAVVRGLEAAICRLCRQLAFTVPAGSSRAVTLSAAGRRAEAARNKLHAASERNPLLAQAPAANEI